MRRLCPTVAFFLYSDFWLHLWGPGDTYTRQVFYSDSQVDICLDVE